jgi:hypothetical protein
MIKNKVNYKSRPFTRNLSAVSLKNAMSVQMSCESLLSCWHMSNDEEIWFFTATVLAG